MKIVFFDIDGTLAVGKEVPESAQKAIQELRQNGGRVWICTGRAFNYAEKYFHQYADGYIVSNGREGYIGRQKIFEKPLSLEQCRELSRRLDEVHAGYAFFSSQQGYYYGPQEGFAWVAEAWDKGFVKQGGDLSKAKVYNMDLWFRDEAHFHQIAEQIKDLTIINPHGSHPTADVTIRGWDKGDALQTAAKYMEVPCENTYAFGDGINDINMLKKAGHGIAMGNGQDALKEIAEYVTTGLDEDGVMNGLKHFHLI